MSNSSKREQYKPFDKYLKDILGVRIESIHFHDPENRFIKYFEIQKDGETLKIRVKSEDILRWFEHHFEQQTVLDFTIFPYKWTACGRSGVVNYFVKAKAHRAVRAKNPPYNEN